MLLLKDDEDTNSSTKEVTLEDMYSAAKEVDGTGTVDTTSNAAERLKLNQATSTTAGENSNQQVTGQRKRPVTPPGTFFLSVYSLTCNPILFLLSHHYASINVKPEGWGDPGHMWGICPLLPSPPLGI